MDAPARRWPARRGLEVIEDAAQGLAASYRGRPLGTLGGRRRLSFHETKNISCGEGGALRHQRPGARRRARRDHPREGHQPQPRSCAARWTSTPGWTEGSSSCSPTSWPRCSTRSSTSWPAIQARRAAVGGALRGRPRRLGARARRAAARPVRPTALQPPPLLPAPARRSRPRPDACAAESAAASWRPSTTCPCTPRRRAAPGRRRRTAARHRARGGHRCCACPFTPAHRGGGRPRVVDAVRRSFP